MKHFSHLNTAVQLLGLYKGREPFGIFIKNFFSQHKKYGSKDRKQISQLCYSYFRLGKSLLDLPVEERVLTGLFLCTDKPHDLLEAMHPEWNAMIAASLEEKCQQLSIDPSSLTIFPWYEEISEGIDVGLFNRSFLRQPDLFIRVRPGKKNIVIKKLEAAVAFNLISDSCISLPNGTKIETILTLNNEAVIQDRSSQEVGELLSFVQPFFNERTISVWDCCAASGGKSIMAKDLLEDIDLTVSDIRESILINLRKRFNEAGINKYKNFVADLSAGLPKNIQPYDLIIADVPCTGSGTWERTPEQLFYFEKEKIEEYVVKQRHIVSTVIPALKPGGFFLYITCSVFKKENEAAIDFIKEKYALQLIKAGIIKGYDEKADTMFAALLQKK
ncbi:MAG: Fmu (Sun) domain-containing protein [Chitinophagaceae bacterium]